MRILTPLLLSGAIGHAAVSFETEVKPIFEKHCVECHGPKKQMSEFRLDDREVALHGLDHEKLTFRHNGADRRLTDVHGHVIKEILA